MEKRKLREFKSAAGGVVRINDCRVLDHVEIYEYVRYWIRSDNIVLYHGRTFIVRNKLILGSC